MTTRRKRRPYRWPGLYERTPVATRCRSCQRPVLSGWHRGEPLVVDRAALTQLGELNALLRNTPTYFFVSPSVYRRRAFAITDEPKPKGGTVHRAHNCDAGDIPVTHIELPPKVVKNERAPF